MFFKNLETNNLILKNITKSDYLDLYNYLSKEEVSKSLETEPLKTEEDALVLINKILKNSIYGKSMKWGVYLKENSELIGLVGYNNIDSRNRKCSIGYEMESDYWKNGYGFEMVTEIIKYAFDDLCLHRIEAEVLIGNNTFTRLLSKLGFEKEGTLKQNIFMEGSFFDTEIYSLIKD